MEKRNQGALLIILIFAVMFLGYYFLTLLKIPAIVIEFKDNDIDLVKIGLVGSSQLYAIVCEGDLIEANVRTPSGKSFICGEVCSQRIGKNKLSCPSEFPKEDGIYSINLKVYENPIRPIGEILIEKNLSGSWSD